MSMRDRIRSLMGERGFSAKALARAAGLNETSVIRILNNPDQNPRVDTLQKIASALEVTTEFLTDGREAGAPAEVIHTWERLTERGRKAWLEVGDTLAETFKDEEASKAVPHELMRRAKAKK